MGCTFEGVDGFGHAGFTVVAGFTFFDFLSFSEGEPFAVGAFAVVAGLAFQTGLMRAMGKLGRFWGFGRINGGFQGDLRWTFVPSHCCAN
jgi:hypothetical protein